MEVEGTAVEVWDKPVASVRELALLLMAVGARGEEEGRLEGARV